MWFAAFSDYRYNAWFVAFLIRLLEGRQEVLALLKNNPLHPAPPRYVRALLYQYHFTDWKIRRSTGHCWRREKKWFYCPVLSLAGEEKQLMPAEDPGPSSG